MKVADPDTPVPSLAVTVTLEEPRWWAGRGCAPRGRRPGRPARRWPAVRFRVEQVAVQGQYAVAEVTAALQALDADPTVDVIIIARGGGSIEDLLPFNHREFVASLFEK